MLFVELLRDCPHFEVFGWDIPLDELVTNLYGLSFASLDYANQKEVMVFISARIEKMIGSKVPKDIREAVLESDTYIVSLILEASQALVQRARMLNIKFPLKVCHVHLI